MYKHKYIIIATLLLIALAWAVEDAQNNRSDDFYITNAISIPKLINYQGKLTNLAGNPVSDSSYSITFRLFNASSGGSAFWTETQSTTTSAGLFNVLLGSTTPVDTIPQAGNCYLEMQVNPNPAMTPRIRLVSSAYAYLAKKADSAGYAPLTRPISPGIGTTEITDGAVTNLKLGPNAVTTDKIQDGTIQVGDLAFTPVTRPLTPGVSSAEILDGAVTMPKINQASATTGQILKWTGSAWTPRPDSASGSPIGTAGGDLTGTYPNPSINGNAVTTGKILNNTILREDVATNFKAPYSDTSDYVRNVNIQYVDSARVSTNAHKLQGKDTIALSAKFIDEGQTAGGDLANTYPNPTITGNAITTGKILNNTILREDVATNFKAPYADTSDYVRNVNIQYVDSTRIAANAHNAYKLQGKDTVALDSRYVNEEQVNSVSSAMIIDNTITRNDVATNFKAPLADTADYARVIPGAIDSARVAANAHKLQGKDTIALSAKFIDEGQTAGGDLANTYPNPTVTGNAITTAKILNNTILREDVATNFKAPYADTSDYVRNVNIIYVDSARIAANSHNAYKLQGKDTLALSSKFVDEGQSNSISSAMIVNGTITNDDISASAGISDTKITGTGALITTFNADYLDGQHASAFIGTSADYGRSGVATDLYEGATTLTNRYINEGQTASGDLSGTYPGPTINNNAVNSAKIADGSIRGVDIAKPCTLDASVTNLLYLKNTYSAGNGIWVDTVGFAGLYVRRAASAGVSVERAGSNGLYIHRTAGNGIWIDSAAQYGVFIDTAGSSGIKITRSGSYGIDIGYSNANGIKIDSTNPAYTGVWLRKAGWNGFAVDEAGGHGVWVGNSGWNGYYISGTAARNGLYVNRADSDGVHIKDAGQYGMWVEKSARNGIRIDTTFNGYHGIWIHAAGGDGVGVDKTIIGSGYYIGNAAGDGLEVSTARYNGANVFDAGKHGYNLYHADSNGIFIGNTGKHGIYIDSASQYGAYINQANQDGVWVYNANDDGFYVSYAGSDGFYANSVGTDGVHINSAGDDGVEVTNAGYGLYVPSATYYGVYANSNDQKGGYFRNNNNNYYALTAYNNTGTGGTVKGLYVQGNAYATGGWSSFLADGKTGFSLTSPNMEIVMSGSGSLSDGQTRISFDQPTQDAISENIPLKVIITSTSECNGVFVSNKSSEGFAVKELISGKSNATFDWIAIGRMKGYEQTPYIQPITQEDNPKKSTGTIQTQVENQPESRVQYTKPAHQEKTNNGYTGDEPINTEFSRQNFNQQNTDGQNTSGEKR